MSRSVRVSVLAFVAAAALAGCGNLTKSPAEGLTFAAPAGFTSRFAMMGMMQMWTKDSDPREVLTLVRMPFHGNANDVLKTTDMNAALKQGSLKNVTVAESRAIKICGGQPAIYRRLSGTTTLRESSAQAQDEYVDMVVKVSGTNALMAMYTYPKATQADPAAEHALRELCPAPAS